VRRPEQLGRPAEILDRQIEKQILGRNNFFKGLSPYSTPFLMNK
jgi:hypothetical protein